jgi:hypothetical protein
MTNTGGSFSSCMLILVDTLTESMLSVTVKVTLKYLSLIISKSNTAPGLTYSVKAVNDIMIYKLELIY